MGRFYDLTCILSAGVMEFTPQVLYLGGAPPSLLSAITGGGVEAVQGCLFDLSFSTNTSSPYNPIDPSISTLNSR